MKNGLAPERIHVEDASAILGVPVRTVQDLAAKKKIPAAKVGRLWTFSPETLRQWLKDQEQTCQRTSTSAERSGGAGSRLPARSSEEAYERVIGRLRSKGRKRSARAL